MRNWTLCLSAVACLGLAACGEAPAPTKKATAKTSGTTKVAEEAASTSPAAATASHSSTPAAPKRTFKPVQLSGTATERGASTTAAKAEEEKTDSVMDALKPLQILLGRWKGNARKALLDEPEWMWDLQSDPAQPALVMNSEQGKYIREGRLTYLINDQKFQLKTVDAEGVERTYVGDFTRPVDDVAGDDKKLQRTYKLEFDESPQRSPDEAWHVAISQQDNNRYLVELDRTRGSGTPIRIDTVNTQREGTSFALSDTDYGDKTCIVSEGLGTMSVGYKGRSYWVCCTGCKAAFEDDPLRWINKLAEREKKKEAEKAKSGS